MDAWEGIEGVPAKDRAEEGILWLMRSQGLRAGDRLPGERELCQEIGVSRTALRAAISVLISNGILESRHGSGTYVRPKKPIDIFQETYNFCDAVRHVGMTPGTVLIESCIARADTDVAVRLGIEPGDPVFRLCRVRTADGRPVMMETAHIPSARFPGIENADYSTASLYDVLRVRYETEVCHGDERISIARLSEEEACALHAAPDAPVFFESAVNRDGSNEVVEYVKSVILPDRFRFASNGTRGGELPRVEVGDAWLRS